MRLAGIFCSLIQTAAAARANVRERFEMWRRRHKDRYCNSPPLNYSCRLDVAVGDGVCRRLSMTFALLVSALKRAMDLTDGGGGEGVEGEGAGVAVTPLPPKKNPRHDFYTGLLSGIDTHTYTQTLGQGRQFRPSVRGKAISTISQQLAPILSSVTG